MLLQVRNIIWASYCRQLTNTGATAFLPSSFALHATNLAFVYAIAPVNANKRRTVSATCAFALGAIWGWPFALVLAVPFVFEELFMYGRQTNIDLRGSLLQERLFRLVKAGLIASLAAASHILYRLVCQLIERQVPLVLVDWYCYGKPRFVPWNIVAYNVFGASGGPDLYGTEPWSYYFINLFLNFNLAFLLALVSLPVLFLSHRFDNKRLGGKPKVDESSGTALLAIRLLPFYLWLALLTSQAHKEERFIFPAYGLLCFNAATALYLIRGLMEKVYAAYGKVNYAVRGAAHSFVSSDGISRIPFPHCYRLTRKLY